MNNSIIDHFDGDYSFLSNFYPSPIRIGGTVFPTVEHYYQHSKTDDPILMEKIRDAATPGKAKRLGKLAVLTKDWQSRKLKIMLKGLRIKFSNPVLKHKIVATGDAILIEGNTWGDTYWGVCNGRGRNMLGKLLMKVRDEVAY